MGRPKQFRAVTRSQYFAYFRCATNAPVLRWLSDCRNTATALLPKKTTLHLQIKSSVFGVRCLGVFIRRSAEIPFKKKKVNVKKTKLRTETYQEDVKK